MNPINFMKGMVNSVRAGSLEEASKASKFLERHSGSKMTSSEKIGDGVMNRAVIRGGKKGAGKFLDDRANSIIEARDDGMIEPKNWAAKQFDKALNSKNHYLKRGASLFYEGDTGKLATGRIAGVASGLGLGAYGVLSDDD